MKKMKEVELKEASDDHDIALKQWKTASAHASRKKMKVDDCEQYFYDIRDKKDINSKYMQQLKQKEFCQIEQNFNMMEIDLK